MFRGHQEIFTVRYLVVTKRFSWWNKFLFWTPPPNLQSRDLVVKFTCFMVTKRFSRWDISWSSRDSLGGLNFCSGPPPLILVLVISWWNRNISWPPRDSRGEDQLLSLLASFPPPRDHEITEWGGVRMKGSPRESPGYQEILLVNEN